MEAGRKCCRWCNSTFVKCWAVNRMMCGNFRSFLPPNDPMRQQGVYGHKETAAPPTPRTHQEMVADALESERYSRANPGKEDHNDHPRYRTGVFKVCPLSLLPCWDMVWDFLPDWMHMTKGYFMGHMLPLMKGKRAPGAPTILANRNQDPAITR
jgi:hypothetical protein